MSVFEMEAVGLPKPNYEYITKEEDARRALNIIKNYDIIEVDSETTAFDPYFAKVSLVQIGIPNKVFIFDVRKDTDHSDFGIELLKQVLTGNDQIRILQNAVFDMKMLKVHGGFYIENIYDTMLTEQIFNLGLPGKKSDIRTLVMKYLGIVMDKEPGTTFSDYYQTFRPFQLEYAANDVSVLRLIRDFQLPRVHSEGFEDVCRLEYEFTKPMCEMELNGINFDVENQRKILSEIEIDKFRHGRIVEEFLSQNEDQNTLFGISLINIDSNVQLKAALNKYGLDVESTDVNVLAKLKGIPLIDALLDYRKAQKFISTYGESLIEKIHPLTNRLHTDFRQMVSTGRMSSANPNLQNIPKKQKYRSCFVSKPGYSLITADMSGAELRILGNYSKDPIFIECFEKGIDLHTRTSSEMFNIPFDKVNHEQRGAAKALNFGLCVEENTSIVTDRGIKKIKDIDIGDVVTHDVGVDSVIDKKFMGEKVVFKIKTKYGYSMEVTRGHVVKVIDVNGNYVDKKIEDVEVTKDYLCIKKNSNLFSNELYDFDTFFVNKNTNYKHFDLPKTLNENWAKFFGLFVSEGSIGKVKGRKKYSVLQFGFSTKEPEFITYIDKLLYNLFGDRLSINYTDKKISYSFNSVLFCEWLSFICDIKGKNKTNLIGIPNCIKQSPRKIQKAFLSYLFEGDGSVKKVGRGYSITYSSKSVNLIKDLQLMLLNFGILSSVRSETRRGYPGELYYELKIVSNESRELFKKHIGFVTKYKNCKCVNLTKCETSVFYIPYQNKKLNRILKSFGPINRKKRYKYDVIYNCINNTNGVGNVPLVYLKDYDDFFNFMYGNDIVPLEIKSIKMSGIKKVYDISVEKHPYFLANGFVVHNCYGLSKFGLAKRLKITEHKAEELIKKYFEKYKGVEKFLELSGKNGVKNRYSRSISGRKRHYTIPDWDHKDRVKISRSVERKAKNARIQGSNADTIKQAMIYLVDRLEESGCDAKLLLTVHDEVVVEVRDDQKYEVKEITEQALIDGFGRYFSLIPMETDGLIGPCWLKDCCENKVNGKECGGTEMIKLNDKIVCKKCREVI